MSDPETPASAAIDTTVPHVARVWNYFLSGKDNYEVDRKVAEATISLMPEVVALARASRAFLGLAVNYLATEAGIDQFLDIGTGLPTVDNTHQIAQRANPAAKIVYVDNDPLVLSHARALLTTTPEGQTDYLDADLRDPQRILDQAAATLDFGRPVALILMGILEFIPDQAEATAIVDHLMDRLPPGSHLALYATTNHVNGRAVDDAVRLWNDASAAPMTIRTVPQIHQFFRGLDLVKPGLVPMHQWRPLAADPDLMGEPVDAYAGIGVKPARD